MNDVIKRVRVTSYTDPCIEFLITVRGTGFKKLSIPLSDMDTPQKFLNVLGFLFAQKVTVQHIKELREILEQFELDPFGLYIP